MCVQRRFACRLKVELERYIASKRAAFDRREMCGNRRLKSRSISRRYFPPLRLDIVDAYVDSPPAPCLISGGRACIAHHKIFEIVQRRLDPTGLRTAAGSERRHWRLSPLSLCPENYLEGSLSTGIQGDFQSNRCRYAAAGRGFQHQCPTESPPTNVAGFTVLETQAGGS